LHLSTIKPNALAERSTIRLLSLPQDENFPGGQRFSTTEELIAEVEQYFAGLEESHFEDGIKALEHHWTKCISLQGDCVEK
jgi:hypothetical protein